MGYVSYHAEKAATKGIVGLLVYGILFMFILAALVAAAGLIAVVLAAMLLVSLLSGGVALWRRHVLHQPGAIGQLRPAGTKPTQWGNKRNSQIAMAKVPAAHSKAPLPAAPPQLAAAAPASPPEPPFTMPKRVTQLWIESNVPEMSPTELGVFMSELRKRNWSDGDLATRVIPHAQVQA